MYLLNGESKHSIEFSDRGFQYGDGLFETIEIKNGSPLFLKQHLQRLLNGCQRLLIPLPDAELLRKEAYQLSKDSDHAILKLIITRGSGGRGYRQPNKIHPTRLLSLHPFPNYSENYNQQGISVRFCNHLLGLNPFLAGIKHMNRLEQILARAEWNSSEIQEGLMMDINRHVIEGTMSNLFVVKENILYTPLIEKCGVEGILRGILIGIANQNKIKVIKNNLSKEDVLTADELFITNSIIGIWPIKQLERQQFKIGLLTTKLQRLFSEIKQQEIKNAY
ncbi:MAG: aminodeoxychorismate lyase [Methylococcales bacterium]|nr:aminodeoxychorismate lyase [Methylococcales bacterium]